MTQPTDVPDDEAPDNTAVRVALWRALHVEIDAPPHVFEDEIGLQLAAPDAGWRQRPDMDPVGTRSFRASIVARARFVEDLVTEHAGRDIEQYVILGAGLDTFAQRRPDVASQLRVFEVDQPGTQAWKRRRLLQLGFDIPEWLRFVPVDFGADESWWDRLVAEGFAPGRPTIVASAGVTMYLTRAANAATLRQVAALAPGSMFATTFLLPGDLLDDDARIGLEYAERGARASGTPFVSFFAPEEIVALALDAGLRDARHVSAADLNARYFAGRTDGLQTTGGEELLLATT